MRQSLQLFAARLDPAGAIDHVSKASGKGSRRVQAVFCGAQNPLKHRHIWHLRQSCSTAAGLLWSPGYLFGVPKPREINERADVTRATT